MVHRHKYSFLYCGKKSRLEDQGNCNIFSSIGHRWSYAVVKCLSCIYPQFHSSWNDRILVKVSDGHLMDLHQKSAQGQGHVCYSLWTLVLISLCSTANRWQENWSLFFSTSRYNNWCAPVFQMHLILGSCWKFVARVVCCHFEYMLKIKSEEKYV